MEVGLDPAAALDVPPALRSRVWGSLVAAWGAFTGLLPHVLHHVGPLAGAALLAGATGRVLFGAIGLVAAVPFLLRLRRRFSNWRAPTVALVVLAAMFSVSSFVVGPRITAEDEQEEEPAGHVDHHR